MIPLPHAEPAGLLRRPRLGQRAASTALGVGLVGLLAAIGLPHRHHEGALGSHSVHPCQLCGIQQGFSASPPSAPMAQMAPGWSVARAPVADAPVRSFLAADGTVARAPPLLA